MTTAAAPQLVPFHDSPYIQYSPLSSGLPSPSFPSPIPLPRGRSPTPSSSRQPSRQVSVRRLSSIVHSRAPSPARRSSDVLNTGDIIGQGLSLHGERIQLVNIPSSAPRYPQRPPADKFQVVRKLGSGSYAVVYLVNEILDPQDPLPPRHFAVKCLSKAGLSQEELEVQMFEATLHQSLPTHPNIVTLYQTLQTPSYLLLLLESVPGEDLFYFLEQSRDQLSYDHDDDDSPSHTPPTPSLLSTLHPTHLLSFQRIKLITSMFSQMCNAVAACHDRGVSHRDIKPENFIVTEGWRSANGPSERRVLVKLTDFGLATLQAESADVDCGSAPYMSYECRNNVAPTYATQPADVWSLGIVLINMLYHHNPWSDTAFIVDPVSRRVTFTCPSFASFLAAPIPFFLQRFPGMTLPVADFLANKVFCLLSPSVSAAYGGTVRSHRVSAREFGEWVRALPHLMGQGASSLSTLGLSSPILLPSTPALFSPVMSRSGSVNPGPAPIHIPQQAPASNLLLSPVAWPLSAPTAFSSLPMSSPAPSNVPLLPPTTPSSANASPAVAPSPARLSLSLPHPPMSPVPETEVMEVANTTLMAQDISTPPPNGSLALDLEGPASNTLGAEGSGEEREAGAGNAGDDGVSFKSVSTKRRGKRGARKKAQQQVQKEEDLQNKLDNLATSFEQLARNLSKTSPSNPATACASPALGATNPGMQDVLNQIPPLPDEFLLGGRLRNSPSRLSISTTNSLTTTSARSGKTTSTASSSKTSSSVDRALAKMPPPPSVPPPAPPVPSSVALETIAKSMSLNEERERAQRSSNRPRSHTTLSASTSLSSMRKNRVIPPPPSVPPPSLPHLQHLQSTYASPLSMSKSPSTLPNALSPLSQSVTIREQIEEEESLAEHTITEEDAPQGTAPQPAPTAPAPTQPAPAPVASVSTKKSWMGRFNLSALNDSKSQAASTPPPSLFSAHVASQLQALQSSGKASSKDKATSKSQIATGGDASVTVNHVNRLISDLEPSRAPGPKVTPKQFASSTSSLTEIASNAMSDRTNTEDTAAATTAPAAQPPLAPVPFGRNKAGSRWGDRSPTRSSESSNWRISTSPPSAVAGGPLALPLSSSALSFSSSRHSVTPSVASGASSVMSSGSSAFSRWSNSSRMSVSTVATSTSGHSTTVNKFGVGRGGAGSMHTEKVDDAGASWRQVDRDRPDGASPPPRPRHMARSTNVKKMDGMPNNLDEPHFLRANRMRIAVGAGAGSYDAFAGNNERKKSLGPRASGDGKSASLDTISEQRVMPSPVSSIHARSDSKDVLPQSETSSIVSSTTEGPVTSTSSTSTIPETKKAVQKGQANALAKMLSSFKNKGRD